MTNYEKYKDLFISYLTTEESYNTLDKYTLLPWFYDSIGFVMDELHFVPCPLITYYWLNRHWVSPHHITDIMYSIAKLFCGVNKNTGKPCFYPESSCKECIFNDNTDELCEYHFIEWLQKEVE